MPATFVITYLADILAFEFLVLLQFAIEFLLCLSFVFGLSSDPCFVSLLFVSSVNFLIAELDED